MKVHVGVDSKTKFIHTILASAANVADKDALSHLLHGEETTVWGDQGYNGQREAIRKAAPKTQSLTNKGYRPTVKWMKSRRPGTAASRASEPGWNMCSAS